jgi:uncharacterized membrane protein
MEHDMAAAARKFSQVVTHMAIGFAITYAVTGSAVFGGLAVLIEPLINVMLVPLHEKLWARFHASGSLFDHCYLQLAVEKFSLAGVHMGVAFAVLYSVSGSLAIGGLAAVLEPVCNVLLMPLHDRMWERLVPVGRTAIA